MATDTGLPGPHPPQLLPELLTYLTRVVVVAVRAEKEGVGWNRRGGAVHRSGSEDQGLAASEGRAHPSPVGAAAGSRRLGPWRVVGRYRGSGRAGFGAAASDPRSPAVPADPHRAWRRGSAHRALAWCAGRATPGDCRGARRGAPRRARPPGEWANRRRVG